jgi:hypothetical protein
VYGSALKSVSTYRSDPKIRTRPQTNKFAVQTSFLWSSNLEISDTFFTDQSL